MLKRDGEKLVWSTGRIVCSALPVAINYVEEVTAIAEPESLIKRIARAFRGISIFLCVFNIALFTAPMREQLERVVPKCIDLNCFAPTRRNYPIAHLRVHPSELITFTALRQQTVPRIDMNIEASARSEERRVGKECRARRAP